MDILNDDTNPSYTPENTAEPIDRFIAFLIDALIVVMLMRIMPTIGFILGVFYLLVRDALPFMDGQSVGKKLLKLKAVDAQTGESLVNKYDRSVLRSASLLIPVFNLVDALMVLSTHRERFGDRWAKTKVIKLK